MPGKVLYLSWAIPPDTSGSAVIALNLLKQFTREEMVAAGERPHGKPPVQWYPEWPEIVYVQSVWPFTDRGVRWWRALQFPFMLWRLFWLVHRHKVDRIVAVYPNGSFLYAGYLLARLTGCKLYAYLHNTYDQRVGLRRRFSIWAHTKVFKQATHVFVMSEGMSEHYRERFPGLGQTPLAHTFSEELPPCEPPPPVGIPMRLVFCGNLRSCADAAGRLAEAIARTPDVKLAILSGDHPRVLQRLGLVCPGTTCETIARDDVPQRLRQADVVLLPHSFTYPESARNDFVTIFPTKAIEYLISGRPILAHSPSDAFLTQFMRKHECALVVDEPSVDALCAAIERLRSDAALRARLVRNALRAAEQFRASVVSAEFRRWLGMPAIPKEAVDCAAVAPQP